MQKKRKKGRFYYLKLDLFSCLWAIPVAPKELKGCQTSYKGKNIKRKHWK
jgi:hypothetical protein